MRHSSTVSVLLSAIILTFIFSPGLHADEEETTTNSYVIIPTTIEPSSDESWESSYKQDFGVPDPSPVGKPTPVRIVENGSSTTEAVPPPPDAVAISIEPEQAFLPIGPPQVYSFKINSTIRYRYCRTFITSRVVNPNQRNSAEIRFSILLPEMAFISRFAMEIDGKVYESYVKEKDEAKQIYNQAQSQGQSAGLIEVNARHSNTFNVNVNIHPGSKINFNVSYEELLERRAGVYEHNINILPEQLNVKDFQIWTQIEESQNITVVRVPDIDKENEDVKDAIIERPAGNKAIISWTPNQESKGLTKFTINYDLARELDSGQVLVNNGYFVHFFSPANLPPLRKHVVFILDTSGSMWGRRIEQLKEAMGKILTDLKSDDYFNIITFASDVVVWDPEDVVPISPNSHWTPPGTEIKREGTSTRRKVAHPATKFTIERAQNYIKSLVASGGTNIHDAVIQGLNLTSFIRGRRDGVNATGANVTATDSNTTAATIASQLPPNVESIIIFLTDGEPTVGVTNLASIQTLVRQSNSARIPIFSLGFGDGADFPFLRRVSLQNSGFARKIYADADAALQLKGFYNEIASPLLSNVTFNYTSEDYSIENVTVAKYVTVFGGGEIVIAGKISDRSRIGIGIGDIPAGSARTIALPPPQGLLHVTINGYGRDGIVKFTSPEFYSGIPGGATPFPPRPTPAPTQEDWFLERLWAYLSIKQLIDEDLSKEMDLNEIEPSPVPSVTSVATTVPAGSIPTNVTTQMLTLTPKQKATRLALKYGFVTPVTSLVVVKPNSSDVTDSVSSGTAPPQQHVPPGLVNRVSVASFAAPIPLSNYDSYDAPQRIVGFGGPPPPMAPMLAFNQMHVPFRARPRPSPSHKYPVFTTATSVTPLPDAHQPATSTAFIRPHTPMVTLTMSTTNVPPSIPPNYPVNEEPDAEDQHSTANTTHEHTLEELSWYSKGALVVVNLTDYKILENDSGLNLHQNKSECVITLDYEVQLGKCEHLINCIQDSFKKDFDRYVKSYFCPVELGNVLYAGVCCSSIRRLDE